MKREYIRFRSQTGKEKTSFESMSNAEEPSQKRRKEEASLSEDMTLNCLARVSRLEHAALSVASNSEEPPQKKREEEAYLIEDVALNCLARVSRLEHAALYVASKSFRSLVASPDLYRIRSLMGRTETCVYVCLLTPPPDQNPRWYILHRRKTLDGLIPIPSLPSHAPEASSVVVLDWGIYVIGGMMKGNKRTSDVWLLDCRTHTWRQVPSMGMARAYAAVGVVDGKIYVLGGCGVYDPKKWGEVFDPKTQTWDALPPRPRRKEGNNYIHDSVVWDQKVYSVDGTDRTNYYSPSQGQWGIGNRGQVMGNRRDWCMIDNLIYFLDVNRFIYWCEPDELEWREPERMMDTKKVKGLDSLHGSLFHSRVVHFGEHLLHRWEEAKIYHGYTVTPRKKTKLEDLLLGARLSNSGGNIMLFWDVIEGDQLEIWCAEISLERRQGGDIWGNIEWSIPVMIVPLFNRYKSSEFPYLGTRSTFSRPQSKPLRSSSSHLKEIPLGLSNKTPRWHEQLRCWCLNFHGRVTVASVKNFQLVAGSGDDTRLSPESQNERIILQFGKVGKDMFTMDYGYPISAFQAFAICLSS